MFLFKSLNVFILSAATKNLWQITPSLLTNSWRGYSFIHIIQFIHSFNHVETSSFICRANHAAGFFMIETSIMKELNQHVFLLIWETTFLLKNGRFLKSTLAISDKYWHSVNLSYCKIYARGIFRTQSNIYNKAFLWFLQWSSTMDVRLGCKYASLYIYIQVSLIEIICKLNIFAVSTLFLTKEEWNNVAISELIGNFLSLFNISLFVFPLHDSFPVTLQGSNLTRNIRHTSFLLVPQKVLIETETAVTRLLGR